jgi:phosphoribosyl-AMP cyclohydrolase
VKGIRYPRTTRVRGRQVSGIRIRDLKFDKYGLIPAIIQDYKTGEVLMLAYMNKESLRRTLKSGKTCFWSRSRKKYWTKGETSGNFQFVKAVYYDCDMDALLIKVKQIGVACHTGNQSCFYRKIK